MKKLAKGVGTMALLHFAHRFDQLIRQKRITSMRTRALHITILQLIRPLARICKSSFFCDCQRKVHAIFSRF